MTKTKTAGTATHEIPPPRQEKKRKKKEPGERELLSAGAQDAIREKSGKSAEEHWTLVKGGRTRA